MTNKEAVHTSQKRQALINLLRGGNFREALDFAATLNSDESSFSWLDKGVMQALLAGSRHRRNLGEVKGANIMFDRFIELMATILENRPGTINFLDLFKQLDQKEKDLVLDSPRIKTAVEKLVQSTVKLQVEKLFRTD